jgi:hypothetical protein
VTITSFCDPRGVESVRTAWSLLTESPTVMLYVGPDQIMPITSALGALVGVALMFWNRITGFVARTWVAVSRRSRPSETEPTK